METYPPPDANTKEPGFAVPPGACDCQVHVFGPPETYPIKPNPAYQPHIVGVAEIAKVHRTLGIERAVIVQATVYDIDNSCMLDALAAGQGRYRGVAVIDDRTTEQDLDRMHEAGVRGARSNFAGFLGMTPDDGLFRRTVERIGKRGWHVIIHGWAEDLIKYEPLFREVRIPVVLDHMGHLDLTRDQDKRALDIVLDLLRQDNWWIKLSNGDRVSNDGPPYADAIPLGRALAEAAPDRAIWGTDWPHVLYKKSWMVNDGDILNLLADYVPDEAARNRILVDNPDALYSFEV